MEIRVRACPVDHGTGCRSQIRIEAVTVTPDEMGRTFDAQTYTFSR